MPAVDDGPTQLEQALGIRFRDPGLRQAALTHRSFAFEQGVQPTNERLEFLGDAVLGLVITDLAYRRFPHLSEGELAKLRASVVNMSVLAEVAAELGLGEAVLGAVYMDHGLEEAAEIIRRLFWPRMEAYARGEGGRDYKTDLQELAAQDFGRIPDYRVVERGPDHQKEFTATVYVGGERFGSGIGRSKKEAEQQAAREAYLRLTAEEGPSGDGGRPEASSDLVS